MTWSYASTAPGDDNKDWVRWRLGLTDTNDQLQNDEEINLALSTYGSKYKAAAAVARTVAATFARRADMTMGDLSIKHSQKSQQYEAIAKELMGDVARDAGRVAAISISEADKKTEREDTDRPRPAFSGRMFSDVEDTISVEIGTTSS